MGIIMTFRKLVYAQVILGVIAYAVAEQNAAMVLAAGTLSTLSWYVVEGPGGKPLPRWLINLGVIAVTIWLFYTQVTRQKPLIIGLGEFILCIQIFKLYERKANRDYAQLIVLSLMQMICASIISAEIVFGILLIGYLALTLFTVLQFQLKMSFDEASEAAMKQAPPGQHPTRPRPVVSRGHRKHFNMTAVACGIGVLATSAILFVLMPRGAGKGILGDWSPPTRRSVSGFDDKVDLSGGTRITTSRVPMMNIQLTLDGQPYGSSERSLLIRGTALDHYDRNAHRWTRTSAGDHTIELESRQRQTLVDAPADAPRLTQTYTLRRQTGGTLFAAYPPVAIQSDRLETARFNNVDQVLSASDPLPSNVQYQIESLHDPQHPNRTMDLYPKQSTKLTDWEQYANHPILPGSRLQAETYRILRAYNLDRDPDAASTTIDWHIAGRIMQYLQSHFAYTLDLPAVPGGQDPILSFLFDTQRGHCEYFASAMTAMLRSIGIRARMVTGFRATEFNSVGGYYVVREKNAHAWVEVYQAGGGWRAFDPSPPGAIEDIHQPSGGIVALVRDLYEYMEFHWINSVITYDANQRRNVMSSLDDNLSSVTDSGKAMWQSLVDWLRDLRERWVLGWWGYGLVVIMCCLIALGVGVLIWTIIRHRRHIRQLQLEAVGRRDQRRLARHLEFYLQMLNVLEKAGHFKPVWQTPASFAEQVTETDPQRYEPVVPLTDLFYEIRFGGRPYDQPRARRIQQHLEQLHRAVRPLISR